MSENTDKLGSRVLVVTEYLGSGSTLGALTHSLPKDVEADVATSFVKDTEVDYHENSKYSIMRRGNSELYFGD